MHLAIGIVLPMVFCVVDFLFSFVITDNSEIAFLVLSGELSPQAAYFLFILTVSLIYGNEFCSRACETYC